MKSDARRVESAERPMRKQIKGFVGATDNNQFAFLYMQALLPKKLSARLKTN